METKQNIQFDLMKSLQIIYRRKWLISAIMLVVISIISFINQLSTPIYRAKTTIVFEEQNGPSASINPFKISFNKNFITKQLEEIKSRSLAEEVAKELPEDVINTFEFPDEISPGFRIENLIAYQIRENISASSVNNSEVIKIEVEANDPNAAETIANTITEVLSKRSVDVKSQESNNVREIIENQLTNYKQKLDDAESALKNFKEQSNVTAIEKEADEIFNRITEAEIKYNQAKSNLDAANKRYSFIQGKLAKERKDLIPSITKITSPWAQQLKQQLVDLEVQYTTLKLKEYAENHPKMQELNRQIQETKSNLMKESLKIASGENVLDPISQIQRFMEELITLEIEIQTYQAQEKTLKNIIYAYKRTLNTIPDKELRLAQHLRDKEVNENIYKMLLQKREEARIAQAEKIGNIRIIDPARASKNPIRPRKILNLILGVIFGSLIGIGLAFLLESFNHTIKSVEEVEQLTKLNVISTIPRIKITNHNGIHKNGNTRKRAIDITTKLIAEYNPLSIESEAFRRLKTSLQLNANNTLVKKILITSSNPAEGKSLIISNLCITTAQMGLKTLLIDADLRKPVLHTIFQRKNEPGLTDLIISNMSNKSNNLLFKEKTFNIEDANIFSCISATKIANLDLLPCGAIPLAPSEILNSKYMETLLEDLDLRYDIIFIDTPPINVVADARILNAKVDGSILVIKAESTTSSDIETAVKLLKIEDNIIGIVVNCFDIHNGDYYYYSDHLLGKRVREHKKSNLLFLQ